VAGVGVERVVTAAARAALATGEATILTGAIATGHSPLSLFTYNAFGELTASGAPIDLGVANANGVAIMAPIDQDAD